MDHPFNREFARNDKELMFAGEELDMILNEIIHRQEVSLERLKAKEK
jgi:hypothetical protein